MFKSFFWLVVIAATFSISFLITLLFDNIWFSAHWSRQMLLVWLIAIMQFVGFLTLKTFYTKKN